MNRGQLIPRTNAAAALIDDIYARRGLSFMGLAAEMGCNHSYLSRVRSGTRNPSRAWVETFIVRCKLTKEEAIRAYEVFGYIPPGYRVIKDAA